MTVSLPAYKLVGRRDRDCNDRYNSTIGLSSWRIQLDLGNGKIVTIEFIDFAGQMQYISSHDVSVYVRVRVHMCVCLCVFVCVCVRVCAVISVIGSIV